MALEIQSSVKGNIATIALSGELDASTAPALLETVDRALANHPTRLILLFEKLTFMASAGLRILIFAKQKQPQMKIYIVKPRFEIVDTLQKTGFYSGVFVTDTEPLEDES